ncbi:uncharacterized protein LOC132738760 [Ruditapes philippinarum]|uniref:uncharacterized protein LOC132738760 n=1 Tax=Ruditapes philippinarum TaxID=129788 RepID=UPI00295BCE76|nr:uncharacterized protein LOC132738760 [Ruditapes philippinarum]
MNAFITVIVFAAILSVGHAFPSEWDNEMGNWNGNNYGRNYGNRNWGNNFQNNEYFNGCGRRESDFGRDTWYFLHTMAANYPENPSPDQQENMMDMMRIFAQFYPRPNNYFRRSMMQYPPDTSNRESFSQWMCMLHNNVNQQTGNEEFDCNQVNDMWTYECYSGEDCDPSRRNFNEATWNFMHTYAYTYPENPSPMQQEDMRQFMYQIAEFNPSNYYYYMSSLFYNKPDTSNRESFMNWMCMTHNYVNARMGKPEFNCEEVWDEWSYNGCDN